MGANNGEAAASAQQSGQNGPSDEEVRQHSAEAAQKSLEAQQAAYELRQAANGAADPEERQKLLEEALDKEIAAESFGKTAKYLRSGTFQGFAVGTGMGIAPGASLGALTGTLVGGVTSLITGGLGGAIGAVTGAIHGPFWNMGEMTGKGIQKITGNLPGWKATWEQKQALERMITDVKNQDMPEKGELESMQKDNPGKTWGQAASSWWPSWGGKSKKGKDGSDGSKVNRVDEQSVSRLQEAQSRDYQERHRPKPAPAKSPAGDLQKASRAQEDTNRSTTQQTGPQTPRKKPRKLEVRKPPASEAPDSNKENKEAQPVKKKPRKLETRSKPVPTAG
ncbi:hypothetical protein M409DRAFT_26016 [Zasmidium cellare ATCC 36951]|uniref:Glycine zipper domain-containing protein n=1 Tax=Zasmidium cellare ATCC 36951 TaxID=1080233 RepID=A0A6A6CEI1_ZASCE|nr:uncharacterized protein M409DRAFT_26016 [Zasmidium cellare ATCC 36951]KAF2163836.1 hypothetical protein M409DRAFT_26016 [Zasmidium cellare ATCC 36951]